MVVPVPGDVVALLRESVEMFESQAKKNGLRFAFQPEEQPLIARFDRERLLQVTTNLLSNAIKFSPRGGEISIRAERAGSDVRVEIVDQGPGIPAGNLEAVFGKFWQAGRYDRRGLGLGLYISRCIQAAHGAKIWAENAPSAGARLVFTLPAA